MLFAPLLYPSFTHVLEMARKQIAQGLTKAGASGYLAFTPCLCSPGQEGDL